MLPLGLPPGFRVEVFVGATCCLSGWRWIHVSKHGLVSLGKGRWRQGKEGTGLPSSRWPTQSCAGRCLLEWCPHPLSRCPPFIRQLWEWLYQWGDKQAPWTPGNLCLGASCFWQWPGNASCPVWGLWGPWGDTPGRQLAVSAEVDLGPLHSVSGSESACKWHTHIGILIGIALNL